MRNKTDLIRLIPLENYGAIPFSTFFINEPDNLVNTYSPFAVREAAQNRN